MGAPVSGQVLIGRFRRPCKPIYCSQGTLDFKSRSLGLHKCLDLQGLFALFICVSFPQAHPTKICIATGCAGSGGDHWMLQSLQAAFALCGIDIDFEEVFVCELAASKRHFMSTFLPARTCIFTDLKDLSSETGCAHCSRCLGSARTPPPKH